MSIALPTMTPNAVGSMPSAISVRVVDPRRDPNWDGWVAAHAEAGPFHTSAWSRVLADSYGHVPCALVLERGGLPVALIPFHEVDSPLTGRRGVAVPFADEGAALVFSPLDPRLLTDVLGRLGRERCWRHLEIRGSQGLDPAATAAVEFYAHELDLTVGEEKLLAGFDSSVRRALRKAEAEAMTVEIRTDQAAMTAFTGLHARTRRRHGLPPQPDRFFEAIRRELLEPGQGAVVLASHQGQPVAASVFLHTGGRAIYKFGASDERVQATRVNNLVMWRGIQWLAGRGARSLHFGRTSCSQDGLRRFKRGWGATESLLNYYKFSPTDGAWLRDRDRAAGRHTAVFSRLPLSLNRLLGAAIYPHLD